MNNAVDVILFSVNIYILTDLMHVKKYKKRTRADRRTALMSTEKFPE